MAAPVTLIVLVAAGEARSPTASSMLRATRDALGDGAVEVRETPGSPTDADVVATEARAQTDATVELIWDDVRHRRATLRVHVARSHKWLERSMNYLASDPVAERGRTLGLAIASLVPEIGPDASPAVPSPPGSSSSPSGSSGGGVAPTSPPGSASPVTSSGSTPPVSPPGSTSSPSGLNGGGARPVSPSESSGAVPSKEVASQTPSGPAPVTTGPSTASSASGGGPGARVAAGPGGKAGSAATPDASEPPHQAATDATASAADALRPETPRRIPRLEVELLAVATAGVPGSATTFGVGAAARWFPPPWEPWVSLRLAASARGGDLDVAEASVFTFLTAAGVALHPLPATRSRPLDVSVRADYLLVRQSATHFASDDPSPVTESRWLSGFDAFVDGGWLLSADVGAFLGLGIEDVLAPTYIAVKDARVATIPSLRLAGELGVRLHF